jgi:hypothetical protein
MWQVTRFLAVEFQPKHSAFLLLGEAPGVCCESALRRQRLREAGAEHLAGCRGELVNSWKEGRARLALLPASRSSPRPWLEH